MAEGERSLLEGWHDVWLFRFLLNMLGYSTIIVPGYMLIKYFKRTNYLDTGGGRAELIVKLLLLPLHPLTAASTCSVLEPAPFYTCFIPALFKCRFCFVLSLSFPISRSRYVLPLHQGLRVRQ